MTRIAFNCQQILQGAAVCAKSARVVLILFVCTISCQCSASALRDTVIIDSIPVIIEPEWDIDTVYRSRSALSRRLRFIQPELGVISGRTDVRSALSGFKSPDELIGSPSHRLPSLRIGFEVAIGRSPRFFTSTGLYFSQHGWNHRYFAQSDIHDSLYQYLAGDGQMLQVLRFRYPGLGSETDTIALPLREARVRYWTLDLPFQIGYSANIERSSSILEVAMGVILRMRWTTDSDPIVLIRDGSSESLFLTEDQLQIRPMGLLARAGVSWVYRPYRKNWGGGLRTGFHVPLSPETSSANIDVQRLETSVSLFFRFFL